ncbi:hypothetical protein [Aminobacter ciceronei]|uniref:Mercuric ion transport protein n=1 Tax=Aminobacter ciceronei TaxID=150723 RepID=A0ABR6C8H1_9HYPH|nr:hypothetical protein [Aminobacter ciceronei]MBA8907589.1 mercuric ion transport protein [Aminobacter ciceronei]MBA9021310.1 mercuric ion transport protein [Aminobacter ciceronei]
MLGFGLAGALIVALCCLAPILLVAAGVIGVGALTTAVYGLVPMFIIIAAAGYLLWRHRPRVDTRKH